MPVRDEHIVARYYLMAPDLPEQTCLLWDDDKGGGSCLVSETVFGAGYSDNYVVAESHPHGTHSTTLYWYIVRNRSNETSGDSGLRLQAKGPFSTQQYATLKTQLHLPEFTTVLTDLE